MRLMGVDFGTCYSSVCFKNGDEIKALKPRTEQKAERIPSVFYHEKNRTLAGTPAVKKGKKNPGFMVEFIKKKLDQNFITLDDREYEPEEIVREILSYVIHGAEESLKNEFQITDDDGMELVVTVPVVFSESRKRLIRDAAQKVVLDSGAQVKVKAVIPEPVAAAVDCFGFIKEAGRNILVFDLGGGTFDTAIVQSTGAKQTYEVVGQGGKGIGGNDWDDRMKNLIEKKLEEAMGSLPQQKKEHLLKISQNDLMAEARKIKEELTELEETEEDIMIQGEYYEVRVTREEFERASSDLLDMVIRETDHLLRKHRDHKVEDIIMVGGGSYMPQVRRALEEKFPECRVRIARPELAVARGAAVYGQMLHEAEKKGVISSEAEADQHGPVLLRATHTYGIGYVDKDGNRLIYNMIFKGEELPVSRETSSRLNDPRRNGQFVVFESECPPSQDIVEVDRGREVMEVLVRRDESVSGAFKTTQKLTLTEDNILEISVTDMGTQRTAARKLNLQSCIV